jgi:Transposase DNA-binding
MRATSSHANQHRVTSLGWEDKGWIDQELEGAYFQDVRLGKRLRVLLGLMANGIGKTIPLACQDWANTKAAYRFFSNPRINEEEILSGHFACTQARVATLKQPLLVLHDTTEFCYYSSGESLGLLTCIPFPSKQHIRIRGLLMHSSLALTSEGIPLGLLAIKFWTRKNFKGTNALKRKINPTRIPIQEKESYRWLENLRAATALMQHPANCVHIADREGDIYELFAVAKELGTKFLIRTCVDRLAEDGTTMECLMNREAAKGVFKVEVRDQDGNMDQATLAVKYRTLRVRPPIGKQDAWPELTVTVIHAREISNPRRRERIEWKLVTNLPVNSFKSALEKIGWYAMRWKIETFHKILKSGCRAEQSKLRTTERLSKLIAVFCILSWRIFWITMVCRVDPKESPEIALTKAEIALLDKLTGPPHRHDKRQKDLGHYLLAIARLGGYLARASDPPPGNTVMWRGVARLTDIHLGFLLAKGDVGN